MFNFLQIFRSLLDIGRKNALDELTSSDETILNNDQVSLILSNPPDIPAPIQGDVTTMEGYNAAQATVLANLGGVFTEVDNLDNTFETISHQNLEDIKNLRNQISNSWLELGTLIDQPSLSKVEYTDLISIGFNSRTQWETDPSYYDYGNIPQANIDTENRILLPPTAGQFDIDVQEAYIDRILGIPIQSGREVLAAFRNDPNDFWVETIHSSEPIQSDAAWLPDSYVDGAAVRAVAQFDYVVPVSEIEISPINDSIELLEVAYANRNSINAIKDADFNSGILTTPGDAWYRDIAVYGQGFTGSASISTPGVVFLDTLSPTGSVFLSRDQISVPWLKFELSFSARTDTDVPFQIILISMDASGNSIGTSFSTFRLKTSEWTEINRAFELPRSLSSASQPTLFTLKIGIPPNMDMRSVLYLRNPSIHPIITAQNNAIKLSSNHLVFLDGQRDLTSIYLVFGQKESQFRSYTYYPFSDPLTPKFERLSIGRPSSLISWEPEIYRISNTKLLNSQSIIDSSSLRLVPGIPMDLIQEMEEIASGNTETIKAFEYEIGAYSIRLRHREFLPKSRFVSKPLSFQGEPREIQIASPESVGNIDFYITPGATNALFQIGDLTRQNYVQSYTKDIDLRCDGNYASNWNSNWSGGGLALMIPANTLYPGLYTSAIFIPSQQSNDGNFVQRLFSSPQDQDWSSASDLALTFSFATDDLITYVTGTVPTLYRNGIKIWLISSSSGYQKKFLGTLGPLNLVLLKDADKYPVTAHFDLSRFDQSFLSQIIAIEISFSWINNQHLYLILIDSKISFKSYIDKVRFIPSDITDRLQPGKFTDLVVPVQHRREIIDGTDRYGRAFLSSYPYINKFKITDLVSILSSNLGGRLGYYDPNSIAPKYLSGTTAPYEIRYTTGYRPISVSLEFPNLGIRALPDNLGAPLPGDIDYINNGIVTPIAGTTSSTLQNVDVNTGGPGPISSQTSFKQTVIQQQLQGTTGGKTYWQLPTKNVGIARLSAGQIPISVIWVSGTTSGTVSGVNIYDEKSGIISIDAKQTWNNKPLDLTKVDNLLASYWYIRDENSPRENFYDVNTVGSSGGIVQTYPVTRNMTDYLTGRIPTLRKPNLDPLDPDYYPVFEYYVDPAGYIVFSESLFKYSDNYAKIIVEYDTLDINPRIVIDLENSDVVPSLKQVNIYAQVRRN